jgi:hypothetical protein
MGEVLRLPNHRRIILSESASGFADESLKRLSEAFTDTAGY